MAAACGSTPRPISRRGRAAARRGGGAARRQTPGDARHRPRGRRQAPRGAKRRAARAARALNWGHRSSAARESARAADGPPSELVGRRREGTGPRASWVDKPAGDGDHSPMDAPASFAPTLLPAMPRRRARLLLGYAGWGPGQLDAELTASAWLTAPPDPALVFETPPAEMWERAIRSLGVDPMALQIGAGIQ